MFRYLSVLLLFSLAYAPAGSAKGVYQQPADFVQQSFVDGAPQPSVLWLKDDLKEQIEQILQHDYQGRRIRYWKKGDRTAWVLEEIGKKKPITTGIVIDHDRIDKIKVLVFRETRGWEVKHSFFTNQFIDAELEKDNRLDRYIDGISGATLSVRALTKLARIALLLDQATE